MPGVFRPYTLVDVLGTMNEQTADQIGNDIIDGLSDFAQTNEQFTFADTLTGTHRTTSTTEFWDAVTWGTFTWA